MLSIKTVGALVALYLAYYLSTRSCCSKKEGITVETSTGEIRGITSLSRDGREFYEWLGIPYAKPPVGELRFALPEPLDKKWDGVRDGSSLGNPCAQVDLITGITYGVEDCLFLNIHVPKERTKLLPVMLFIHGGYYASGSGGIYKPNYFMDEDVVLVTINYRLASLGFLNTGDEVVRGNMGLKDQTLALKWVNENIKNFGGDPNQVTIFGESAGAASVHFHLLSPMSRGLMHRAISHSGTALNMWASYDDPKGQAEDFARQLKCPISPSSQMVECIRNADVADILKIQETIFKLERVKKVAYVPTVESVIDKNTFLHADPETLINSGQIAKIPWLTGFNADEGLFFMPNLVNNPDFVHRLQNDKDFLAEVLLYLTPSERKYLDEIIESYYGKGKLDLLENFDATKRLAGDRFIETGAHKAAIMHSQHAPVQFYLYNKTGPSLFNFMLQLGQDPPSFLTILNNWFRSAILGEAPPNYGVNHFDELAMLFEVEDIFNVPKNDQYYGFSKDMVKTWVSFASAKNVDNVGFRGVKFPTVKPQEELKVLEIRDEPHIIKSPSEDRMKYWKWIETESRKK